MATHREILRQNLNALLGIVSNGLFTMGRDMKIRSMNCEAERLLGLEAGEGIGHACRDVLGPHMCSTDCAFRLTMQDRRPRSSWMVRVVRKDGAQRDLVLSTTFLDAVEDDDREVAISLRDVTEAERLRRALRDRWVFHGMVTASGRMKEVFSFVRETAVYDSTVLLLGESGTGKELVARALHQESPRRERPFVTVNCSAYQEGVLESELFGHVRGSFTGATRDRQGRFEAAGGGTVFLDEIGEIPPAIQVKLLHVLQERTVERVGEQTPVPVDIRVVAATNRDLRKEVAEERFREDLYYRLNVITLRLPPLRDRREDIPALSDHFVSLFAERTRKAVTTVSEEALEILFRHDWPGNVRELENAVEHAVVRSRGPVILPRDLPPEVRGGHETLVLDGDVDSRIAAALTATGGKVGQAAAMLGIHRTTIWRRLKQNVPDPLPPPKRV